MRKGGRPGQAKNANTRPRSTSHYSNRIQYCCDMPEERHRRACAPGLGGHAYGAGAGRDDDRASFGLPGVNN
jgi:hypothetical protein